MSDDTERVEAFSINDNALKMAEMKARTFSVTERPRREYQVFSWSLFFLFLASTIVSRNNFHEGICILRVVLIAFRFSFLALGRLFHRESRKINYFSFNECQIDDPAIFFTRLSSLSHKSSCNGAR